MRIVLALVAGQTAGTFGSRLFGRLAEQIDPFQLGRQGIRSTGY